MKKTASLESYEYRGENSPEQRVLEKKVIRYKEDHENLPTVILENHHLLVFTECPTYKQIYPYLISFSEPIYRPKVLHEYKITKFSLYTAMVLQYSAQEIIDILKKISKNLEFPLSLHNEICRYMRYAGQVKFSLIGD